MCYTVLTHYMRFVRMTRRLEIGHKIIIPMFCRDQGYGVKEVA